MVLCVSIICGCALSFLGLCEEVIYHHTRFNFSPPEQQRSWKKWPKCFPCLLEVGRVKTNKALGIVELQPVLKCRSQEAFRENPTETRVA